MTTNDWIAVALAVGAGLIIGLVLSRVLHTVLGKAGRPEPIQQAAGPMSSLGFSLGVVGGLLVALGIIQPSAVEQLTNDAVRFVPKALTAAIIVILANVLSSFATAALGTVLARSSPAVQNQAVRITRGTILVLAVLLAVPTLGIDTTVVNLGVAAVFFGLAASFTLLVGLGGRAVAQEVASTRAVRRLVHVGDTIQLTNDDGTVEGEVVAVHPTSVEVLDSRGHTLLIPSSRLVAETFDVRRAVRPPAENG